MKGIKINLLKTGTFFVLLFLLLSCNESISIPKPPTYLRLNLPEHEYVLFSETCPYEFEAAKIFKIRAVTDEKGQMTCHKDIDLGPLNGVIHFSYIEMENPLADYVNFAINKVDEHKVKATAIEDTNFIRPNDRVFGTFFELQGDVASPFQFYLTDSTNRFVSGVVYLNSAPNYDSLRPSLEYLKQDLYKMMSSFRWKK
jgi:gliding motility-associated lipoprotein GldD